MMMMEPRLARRGRGKRIVLTCGVWVAPSLTCNVMLMEGVGRWYMDWVNSNLHYSASNINTTRRNVQSTYINKVQQTKQGNCDIKHILTR